MSICALHVVYYVVINILFFKAVACSACKWATVSTNWVIQNGNWHCACSSCTLCCTWACSKVSSHPVSNRKRNNIKQLARRPTIFTLYYSTTRIAIDTLQYCVIWNLNKILYRANINFQESSFGARLRYRI